MKKYQNKKVKSQIIFIGLVLVSALLLIINFIPAFHINAGLTTEFTGVFYSVDSIYVNQSDPNMNYYDDFGYSRFIGNSCETYLHYNFALLPTETERLYFSLSGYDFYDTDWIYPHPVEDVEINIIFIEESWNVSEITWNNKPEHGEIINTANISNIVQWFVLERYDLQKAADITEFYKNHELEEISLCINITNNNEGLNNTSVYLSPRLLWNYEKVILSYTNIISTSIIFSMLIGTIYLLRKDISYCENCGAKRDFRERICPSCKARIKEDYMIKGCDFQLILILLCTFIFLEVSYIIMIFLYDLFGVGIVAGELFISIPLIILGIIYFILLRKLIIRYKNLRKELK